MSSNDLYIYHSTVDNGRLLEEDAKPYPTPGNVIGLCVGSLSAAAVVASRSLSELLPISLETVGIAFRVGLQTYRTSRNLSPRSSNAESWSWIFQGLDLLPAKVGLEDFNRDAPFSSLLQPYISAVGPNALTISGPPFVLKKLEASSKVFSSAVRIPTQVHSPYHHSKIYSQVEAEKLVYGHRSSTAVIIDRPINQVISFYSPDGEKYQKDSLSHLLIEAVNDALKETLRWDLILKALVAELDRAAQQRVNILAFGPSKATNNLVTALNDVAERPVDLQDASSWSKPSEPARNNYFSGTKGAKLAIVGLAGRFPGGANPEEFWKVLEDGLDVCKEV